MKILLHTSKTMKPQTRGGIVPTQPIFIDRAQQLMDEVRKLDHEALEKLMNIKPDLAQKVIAAHEAWSCSPETQTAAVDTFVGDIYSGLQANKWSLDERGYAHQHLYILSGLYGVLRPNDGIMPYRLEMGYPLKTQHAKNLYEFWGDQLSRQFEPSETVINLSAVEYTKALLPYLQNASVITPRFLTMSAKTHQPTFVVVHAKIARGAFASWLIKQRAGDSHDLHSFTELGYGYSEDLSSEKEPVFVCHKFGGIGMSVRLK